MVQDLIKTLNSTNLPDSNDETNHANKPNAKNASTVNDTVSDDTPTKDSNKENSEGFKIIFLFSA